MSRYKNPFLVKFPEITILYRYVTKYAVYTVLCNFIQTDLEKKLFWPVIMKVINKFVLAIHRKKLSVNMSKQLIEVSECLNLIYQQDIPQPRALHVNLKYLISESSLFSLVPFKGWVSMVYRETTWWKLALNVWQSESQQHLCMCVLNLLVV